MSYTISTSIDISGSVETVYNHLIDIHSWSKWNPFIIQSKIISNPPPSASNHSNNNNNDTNNKLQVGTVIENTLLIDPIKQSKLFFRPTVTKLNPILNEFEWCGSLGIRYLFDGIHNFKLIKMSETQTKLIHSERFSGLLIFIFYPFLGMMLMNQTRTNFIAMNKAIKQLTEQQQQQQQQQ